jgi:hypothetical protein
MRSIKLVSVALAVSFSLSAFACGSADEPSIFEQPPVDPNGDGDGTNIGDLNAGKDGGGGTSSGGGDGASCATVNAKSELTPVNLVVLFDRSGSMGDTTENPSYNPALRWVPVGDGLKAFFEEPASVGMHASLTFFPASGSPDTSCNAADYATADLSSVALPSAALRNRIDAVSPRGDTPTRPALQGAIAQAQALRAAKPTEKTVIVMATDGEPWACGVNSGPTREQAVTLSALDAQAAIASDIKTYVIGVGPSVGLLNQIAAAGGTGSALLVTAGDPNKTRAELLAALGAIRSSNVSCDVPVPAAPDGRTLDVNKVDVSLGANALAYSQDCANPKGWHFDDVNNPKQVKLCTESCTTAKTAGGNLTVSFACTNVRIIK